MERYDFDITKNRCCIMDAILKGNKTVFIDNKSDSV